MMKKLILLSLLPVACMVASVGSPVAAQPSREGDKVVKANYELAARFSAKKVGQMVHSTRIQPCWFKESDRFWYEWKTGEGSRWWMVDPASGRKTELFDRDRMAMRLTEIVRDPFDARHLPLQGLELQDDKYLVFNVTSTADTRDEDDSTKTVKKVFRFRYDFAADRLEEVPKEKKQYPDWANVSPDGTMGVYVKNHNLFVMDSTSLRKAAKDGKDSTIVERQLTFDGTADSAWGSDNYMGDTERDSTVRHFTWNAVWSPDSRRVATVRWDMSKIGDLWVIDSRNMPRPKLETYKYQMPGEPGPTGDLWVIEVDGGAKRLIPTHAFKDQDLEFLTAPRTAADAYEKGIRIKWLGDSDGFWMLRRSRDLKRTDLIYAGVAADSVHTVVREQMNTYVEVRNPRFLPDGRFVWWSERNGWANLYLYEADGTLVRNITEGAFHVEDVLAVGSGYVLASACGVEPGENPYQMHTYRVSLAGGAMQRLDMPDMDVLSVASDDAKYFVANYSRVDAKPAVALYGAAGKKILDLEEADFSQLFAAGYRFPERFTVKAADGVTDLYGAMYKPFDFDSTKVYPICDYVYPGPQVEANNISWSRGFTRTDRLAQIGVIVITVGNRGGHPNRSKWYHNYGYGNLRDYGLEDQKYAIQQLQARHSYIDPERVGIHGHSGGGFMSTAAILKYPDFFKAAVSCAGNHDNSIYNRWWSEQHHGILEKIDKGDTTFVYHIDTNQELASRLKGHLMLVTGDMDNNVNPAGTIRVANALIKANKRFEYVVLPGQRHGFGDMNEYFFWKMADWYGRWLIGDDRGAEVDIKELNND